MLHLVRIVFYIKILHAWTPLYFFPGINHQIPYIRKIWMKAARFSTSLHYLPPYVIVSISTFLATFELLSLSRVIRSFWFLEDDLSLTFLTLQGPVDRFREQRYDFKKPEVESSLTNKCKTKRKKEIRTKKNRQCSLSMFLWSLGLPCSFGVFFNNSRFAVAQFLSGSRYG